MAEHAQPRIEPATRRRRGPLFRLARIAVVLGIIGAALRLTGCAEAMFFHPTRRAFETPSDYEDVEFESADGTQLHGWFMPATGATPSAPGPAVLHVHGNAGNLSVHDSFSDFLPREGVAVFLFDYRRYGRSEDRGPLRRDKLLEDTRAALAYLRSRPAVDPDRVGLYGVSLGGPFALHAAAEEPAVRAVVTVSTFSTWPGVANDFVPVLGSVLVRGGLSAVDAAAALGDRPYLIVHGRQDAIVDVRHADILAEAAREAGVPTTVWIEPDGDHNRMLQTSPEARAQIVGFFSDHLGTPAQGPGPG